MVAPCSLAPPLGELSAKPTERVFPGDFPSQSFASREIGECQLPQRGSQDAGFTPSITRNFSPKDISRLREDAFPHQKGLAAACGKPFPRLYAYLLFSHPAVRWTSTGFSQSQSQ